MCLFQCVSECDLIGESHVELWRCGKLSRWVLDGTYQWLKHISADCTGIKYRKYIFSSGGFMVNSQVRGTVHFGSQQQCMTGSSTIGGTSSGVWNMVFVGRDGSPANHCSQDTDGGLPIVVVDEAPAVAERPLSQLMRVGLGH